jgi:hypothetical protein
MADAREEFSFMGSDLGIVSTEETSADYLSSFLSDTEPPKKEPAKVEEKKKPEDKKPEEKEQPEDDKTPKPEEHLKSFLDGEEGYTKKEEDKKDDKENKEEESTQDPENVFTDLATHLFELGIFTRDEDEEEVVIDNAEDFKERFEYEKKKGASEVLEAYLSRFGDDYADMFEKVFVKGLSPKEYLTSLTVIASVKGLDLNDEANQEKVVKELLRREGRSLDYINRKIEQLKNYQDLEQEAKEAQALLIQKEEQEQAAKIRAREEEERNKILARKQYLQTVGTILKEKVEAKEFDGIPVDARFAQEIGEYITRERYKVGDTEITEFDKELLELKKPENFALKVKLAMLLKMLKTDPTLSKIQKKAVSKEKTELFSKLVKNSKQTPTVPKKEEEAKPKSWFS